MRQVYALARGLCEGLGQEWPSTRAEASTLIERLRLETAHPALRLEDCPAPRRRKRRPNPWWQHVKSREEGAMTSDDDVREELVQAARERLRERLAAEAEALDADAAGGVAADLQAFLARLGVTTNTG